MSDTQVFVVSGVRTPIGSFQGELKSLSAPALGAHAIRAAVDRAGIDAAAVDEVIVGNVVSAGVKQAPARQAARLGGLPDACGATTINKVCGSGMKATMLATDLLRAGSAQVVIAGGMESMTNAPYLLAKARQGLRMGHDQIKDAMFLDGLEDAETGRSMGTFAQDTADRYQITREEMDAFATRSVERARAATGSGELAHEIAPMTIGDATIAEDEQPRRARIERIPTLKPAFRDNGTITAANSSSISDGASALLLATDAAVREHRLSPLAHDRRSCHPFAPSGRVHRGARRRHRSAAGETGLESRRRGSLRNQRSVCDGDHDRDARTRLARGPRQHLRRRLCAGPPDRLDRKPLDRDAGARPEAARRAARHRIVVHRRR